MKLLFIGDIVGRPGRQAVAKILPEIVRQEKIDYVVANGENLSGGRGMTKNNYDKMIETGIDLFTTGNHLFDKEEIIQYLDNKGTKILRPANYPKDAPGKTVEKIEIFGQKIIIVNLLGRVFIPIDTGSPFETADRIIKDYPDSTIIIDFHAEATSEKEALFHYLDGRVAAIIGTHTHVPTADAQISKKGTAFVCDVGKVGLADSVLGFDSEPVIKKFLTSMPGEWKISSGRATFNSVILETDKTGKAINFRQLIKLVE